MRTGVCLHHIKRGGQEKLDFDRQRMSSSLLREYNIYTAHGYNCCEKRLFVIHYRGPVWPPQRPDKATAVFHLISAANPAVILVAAPSGQHIVQLTANKLQSVLKNELKNGSERVNV